MTTSSPARREITWKRVLAGGVAVLMVAGALFVWWSSRISKDSPLARMYRTESDLIYLRNAIESYRAKEGAYPPAGPRGLREAVERLSGAARYLPDGPPCDAWGRPYCYVPNTQYAQPGSRALGMGGAYAAPDTFQVYSVGADGDAGLDNPALQKDNITCWEAAKPWRPVYRQMDREERQAAKSP